MKCKRLCLVALGLSLVISPAFCGWAFLGGSKKSSTVLKKTPSPTSLEVGKVVLEENTEEVVTVEEVATVKEAPLTLEEGKTNYLDSQKKSKEEIASLSTKLNKLEEGSILSQSNQIKQFRQDLTNLTSSLTDNNSGLILGEELLNDYDIAYTEAEHEIDRFHLGLGTSYTLQDGDSGISLDTYVRKNNLFVNGSVGCNLSELSREGFDASQLSYKVGVGYEF